MENSPKNTEGKEETFTKEQLAEATRKAQAEEKQRHNEIYSAVRAAKLDDKFAQTLINENKTIDEARAAIIDEWSKNSSTKEVNNVHVERDQSEKERDAAIAFLTKRSSQMTQAQLESNFTKESLHLANEFRGFTLLDLAKWGLERAGVNYKGLDKMEIVGRAFTQSSSDFPILLSGTARRVLLAAYQAAADVWRQFCAVGSVSDFRETERLRLGGLSSLDEILENGEIKSKPINDAEKEKIKAKTYGNIINITRVMVINDDLGGFTRLSSMLGRAAARTIEKAVFSLFALNSGNGPTMVDGNPLFHTSHGNLMASGGVPSVAQFEAMKVLMAKQVDIKNSEEYLDIRPSLGLFPIELEGEAKVLNSSQYDPDASNKLQKPNKVVGLLNNIVASPRLSATPYYFLADPSEEPVFEVVFLDGMEMPFLDTQNGWNVDGTEMKVRHDFGYGAIGYKGIVKNPGA